MRFKLPLVGEVSLFEQPNTIVKTVKEKSKSVGAGVFGFNNGTGLSNYKTVSDRLLKANEGWVYKNNDVIAKEVGAIEFELFTSRVVGGDIVLTPILSHPLLEALDRFNEFTSSSDGFYTISSHKNLTGDAFVWVNGQGVNIQALYILAPDKIELQFGEWQGGQRLITGYKFTDTVETRKEETYPAEDVVHFKLPNPGNPYRGKSKVEAAAEEIDTYNLAREANKNFFKRGMITNFFLSTDKALTEEQTVSITNKLNSAYRGAQNAFKVMVMSGGLKPEPIQASNRDSQFIDQMKYLRDVIMSVFGNTPSVLGIVEDVNRANAEAGILNWKRSTIKPEMQAITDTLNEFLVPRFGDNLILGFKDPVPEDRDSKVTEAVQLVGSKIITQNEARESLGYDAVQDEGADELNRPIPPQLQINEEELPKSVQNINYKAVFRRNGAYDKLIKWKQLKEAAKPIARTIINGRKKKDTKEPVRYHPRFTNEVVMEHYAKQMHVIDANEDIFADKVKKFIDSIVEKAVSNIPDEIADMKQKALIDEEDEIARAVIDFTPLLNDVALLSGQQALSLIGDNSPYISRSLRPSIEKRVKLFAQSMLETDQAKITDMIAKGLADGSSVANIQKQITDEFEQYSRMQAERITRTEVLRASNVGTLDAFEQSDVVVGKQWLTAGATDECAQYEGKVEYNLKGNFFAPDNEFQDGDPPLHPNCRCTLLPVLEGDKAYMPETIMQRDISEKRIKELEEQVDKRTKAYKELKKQKEDVDKYVKGLEEIVDEESRPDKAE